VLESPEVTDGEVEKFANQKNDARGRAASDSHEAAL
jgi:hypothetical protein